MALVLQELLHRVAPFLGESKDEVGLQALRTAARRLARETLIWQVDAPLIIGDPNYASYYGVTDFPRYTVALDTATTPPTDIDSPYYNPAWFQVVRVLRLAIMNDDFTIKQSLRPYNDRELMDRRRYSPLRTGPPGFFASFGDQVAIWPIPDKAYSYAGTVALVPMGSAFTSIDFPSTPECEDALVYQAVAEVLMHPGKHQDKELAVKFEKQAERAILDVRILAELGGSGHYSIKNFPGWSGFPIESPVGRIFY